MTRHTKINIFQNIKRIRDLNDFRGMIINYFNNTKPMGIAGLRLEENQEAKRIRGEINKVMHLQHSIILATGLIPELQYTPAPSIGGHIRDIDLVINIFDLSRFEISAQHLIDYIEQAIGLYEQNQKASFFRTINPFHWIGLIFDNIVSYPFRIFGKLGFDEKKIEASIFGKIIKGLLYLATSVLSSIAALFAILSFLGYLDPFLSWLKKIFKIT